MGALREIPRYTLGLMTALAIAGLAGCRSGPALGDVRGKATFKGKPVTEGTVSFINPSGGDTGEASLGPDGSYQLPRSLPVGDYVVIVTPLMHMVDTDPGKTPPSPEEKPAPNIPRKYRAQHTSPLKFTIKEGPNTFDFDMAR